MARTGPAGVPGNDRPAGATNTGGRTSVGGTSGGGDKKKEASGGFNIGDLFGLGDIKATGPAPMGTGGRPSGQGAGGGVVDTGGGGPTLPQIPDVTPIVTSPVEDLSPLSEAPVRKPLRSSLGSLSAATGITGYAGVFIP